MRNPAGWAGRRWLARCRPVAERPARFGHHFVLGLQPSPTLTEHDRRLLDALRPAGVILFRENFLHGSHYEEWLEALGRLLAEVRSCVARERLIVAIDHEGGRVQRPPAPITHFAYAAEWAERSAEVGCAMGVELRSLGVNVNFAPVLDVDSNQANPVIGPRSFGPEPEAVARAGVAFLEGLQSAGVAGCPKHFPGHGDTQVDSHFGLPVVEHGPELLSLRELVPFRAAIEAGARLVMTAHILFPKLDPAVPATLSRRVVAGLLRQELGFEGLAVTDDIGMQAVSAEFERPAATGLLLNAGIDLIAICAYGMDTARAKRMAGYIEAGRSSGVIGSGVLEASEARIELFLGSLPQYEVVRLGPELFTRHASLAPLHREAPGGAGTGTGPRRA